MQVHLVDNQLSLLWNKVVMKNTWHNEQNIKYAQNSKLFSKTPDEVSANGENRIEYIVWCCELNLYVLCELNLSSYSDESY